MTTPRHIVWGPELSPFLLKLESLLVHAGVRYRRLPRDGSRLENLRVAAAIDRAKRKGQARRPPSGDPLDEYPLVPYLVTAAGEVLYDSSALAGWLDAQAAADNDPRIPREAALRFLCLFLDEAFDEFGLYLVHHNRWKLAATDNDVPGRRLAHEYRRLLPPGVGPFFARWFARRQVRRLPYLFSVAPEGYRVDGLAASLTPPSRAGFPPTHDLLEESWEAILAALESLLARQPFLLGDRFTLADASAYGQLSMNLTDTAAARRLKELAPLVFAWLEGIRDGRHAGVSGELRAAPGLQPLLEILVETFAALMRANEAAWERHRRDGQTLFNEAAFDAGLALYDGVLRGHPFRSVAKSFQARVWRDLRREWEALAEDARQDIVPLLGGKSCGDLFAPVASPSRRG
ncbi:MAG: glutathione S-transferase domain-containing protein [Candidatus Binatia bacterium]